jgi:hypothetical protein
MAHWEIIAASAAVGSIVLLAASFVLGCIRERHYGPAVLVTAGAAIMFGELAWLFWPKNQGANATAAVALAAPAPAVTVNITTAADWFTPLVALGHTLILAARNRAQQTLEKRASD